MENVQPAAALPLAILWTQHFILEKRGLLAILLKASLEPAALSVLLAWLHVSDDRRVEKSDCFMGPAERGLQFLSLGQGPSSRQKTCSVQRPA